MRRSPQQVPAFVEALKTRYSKRDRRMMSVAAVRRGDYESVYPGMFPDELPMEIVENAVDVFARSFAETMSPLPSFNCSSSNMVSDRARDRADKRTKIMAYYVRHSKLATQMTAGADSYITNGFMPIYVEPDFDAKCPRLTVEPAEGGYPEFDRWGRVTSYTRVFKMTVAEAEVQFPEIAGKIRGDASTGTRQQDQSEVELVRYCDAYQTVLFLPARSWMEAQILTSFANPLGECPVKVAVRPRWDEEVRGQWDSVMYIQLARARMAQLAWEAGEKAVQAPIAMPDDVQDFAFGADAVIYSKTPEKVRRVGLDIPQSAFAEMANLGNEMRLGGRYPEGRSGNLSASVVTGRGVQELNAGFDTQVQDAQVQFAAAFEESLGLAAKMDETFWANVDKTIRGTQNDAPYEVKYRPSRDIDGDYTVDVVYGMAQGMDPNRAVVMLLQLRGDGAISRDFLLRQMPFQLNVTAEQERIDVEQTRDAVITGITNLAASIPQMAAMGQDPVDVAMKLAKVVAARQKGRQIEQAFLEAFQPPEPPPAPVSAAPPGSEPMMAPGPGEAQTPAATGGPGVGGAPPDLATALATLTSGGQAQMRVGTARNRAI